MRRRYGALVPVELAPGIPATLVIGYHTAVRILNDPEHFPADSRMWQRDIPRDCPVLSMLEWRPGPFHRSLTALPVGFPESAPLRPQTA